MAEAETRDRTKRYANSPKGAKKHGGTGTAAADTGAAQGEAKKTAGGENAPHPKDPDKVGKVGQDPGPEGGHDAEWGVITGRHKREQGEMLKRHGEEKSSMTKRHGDEQTEMHGRHEAETKAMQTRHQSELEQVKGAEGEAAATAGTPKELGKEKSEGTKGSEP